jgi:hypothetical protein
MEDIGLKDCCVYLHINFANIRYKISLFGQRSVM